MKKYFLKNLMKMKSSKNGQKMSIRCLISKGKEGYLIQFQFFDIIETKMKQKPVGDAIN